MIFFRTEVTWTNLAVWTSCPLTNRGPWPVHDFCSIMRSTALLVGYINFRSSRYSCTNLMALSHLATELNLITYINFIWLHTITLAQESTQEGWNRAWISRWEFPSRKSFLENPPCFSSRGRWITRSGIPRTPINTSLSSLRIWRSRKSCTISTRPRLQVLFIGLARLGSGAGAILAGKMPYLVSRVLANPIVLPLLTLGIC